MPEREVLEVPPATGHGFVQTGLVVVLNQVRDMAGVLAAAFVQVSWQGWRRRQRQKWRAPALLSAQESRARLIIRRMSSNFFVNCVFANLFYFFCFLLFSKCRAIFCLIMFW